MATYNLAASGNWNSNSTWTSPDGGTTFPVAGDTANVTSTHNLTINVASACANIDFTGYTGTLTINNTLTVSNNITFVTGFTVTTTSGTPLISKTTGGTITCPAGGFTWPYSITFVGLATYTLTGGDLTVNGTLTATTNTVTINSASNIINVRSVTATSVSLAGTAKIVFNQSGGTWTGYITSNVDINIAPTASPDITFTNAVKSGGTLNFLSGNFGTPSLNIRSTTTILNISNVTSFANFWIGGYFSLTSEPFAAVQTTVTADGDIACTTLTLAGNQSGAGQFTPIINSNDSTQRTISCSNLTLRARGTGGSVIRSSTDTFSISMNGTGQYTYSNSGYDNATSFATISTRITFNTTGTITFVNGTGVTLQAVSTTDIPRIVYTSGNFALTTSTNLFTPDLTIYHQPSAAVSCTYAFDTSLIEWNSVLFTMPTGALSGAQSFTINFNSDFRCRNLTLTSDVGGGGGSTGIIAFRSNITGLEKVIVSGNFTVNGAGGSNTATRFTTSTFNSIDLVGTGVWTSNFTAIGTIQFTLPVVIDTPGKITIRATGSGVGANSLITTGRLNYIKGVVEVEPNVILRVLSTIGTDAARLLNNSSAIFTNINKIPFRNVVLYAGSLIRMNEFFGGKPGRPCVVSVNTTTIGTTNSTIGSRAAIVFTNTFSKVARWVRPEGILTPANISEWRPSTGYTLTGASGLVPILRWTDNVYIITAGSGTTGTTPPTHESGAAANGGFTFTFYGKVAQTTILSREGNRNSTNLGFFYGEGGVPYGPARNNPIAYQASPCFGIGDNPADPITF